MSRFAKAKGGSDAPQIPDGMHPALCCWVVDVGRQVVTYHGHDKEQEKVIVTFEFPDFTHVFDEEKGPERRVMSRVFTNTLDSRGHLRPFLNSWRGRPFDDEELKKGFDVFKLAAVPAVVLVETIQREDGENYKSVTKALPYKGEPIKSMVGIIKYSVEEHDPVIFEHLPEWIQQRCMKSLDWPDGESSKSDDLRDLTEPKSNDWKDEDKIPF
jgi:hypothetical protein